MKKTKPTRPSRGHVSVLRQLCQLIPPHLVPKLARATGADRKARTFQPWSHVVAMLYAYVFGLSLMSCGRFDADMDEMKRWIADRIAR